MTQKNSDSSVTEYEEDEDEEDEESNVDWKRNRTRNNNKNVSPPVHDSGDTFQTNITEQLDTLHAVQFVHESFFGLNLVPSEASGSLEIGPWPFFDKSKFDEKQVDDKSSVITLSELSSSSLSRTKVSLPPITLNCANLLRHVFDRYDTNKDGILSREDLDAINEKCGFDTLTQEMYDWILSLEDSRHCTVDCFYSYFSWLALSEPRTFRRVLRKLDLYSAVMRKGAPLTTNVSNWYVVMSRMPKKFKTLMSKNHTGTSLYDPV